MCIWPEKSNEYLQCINYVFLVLPLFILSGSAFHLDSWQLIHITNSPQLCLYFSYIFQMMKMMAKHQLSPCWKKAGHTLFFFFLSNSTFLHLSLAALFFLFVLFCAISFLHPSPWINTPPWLKLVSLSVCPMFRISWLREMLTVFPSSNSVCSYVFECL